MSLKNLAVLISGEGSNLQVILDQKQKLQNIFVVSSNADANGLKRAEKAGVKFLVLDKKIDWPSLHEELSKREMDCIFCAGFMRIIPESFINQWEGRIFNLHPSLLPRFKGLKAIERAFAEKADLGVSIHHVSPEVDGGKVVFQEVAVTGDEVESLSLEQATERVQSVEHQLVDQWLNSRL